MEKKRGFEQKINQYVEQRGNYGQMVNQKRLKEQVTGKMRTMMIGMIAQLEKYFGKDWGHGLLDNECNDRELDKRAMWKMCREAILDFGNTKIREAEREISKYEINKNDVEKF